MTDITGVTAAFAGLLGLTAQLWGYILGAVVVVALLFIFTWGLGSKNGPSNQLIMLALGLGIVINVLIGWFDAWVVIFMGLIIAFILINPFTTRVGAE